MRWAHVMVDGSGEESAELEVALGSVEGVGAEEEGAIEFGVARGGGFELGGRGGRQAKVGVIYAPTLTATSAGLFFAPCASSTTSSKFPTAT